MTYAYAAIRSRLRLAPDRQGSGGGNGRQQGGGQQGGGSGSGGGDDDEGDEGDDEGSGDDDGGDEGDEGSSGSDPKDPKDAKLSRLSRERREARRKLRETEAELERLQTAERERKRKEAEKDGNWQEVAQTAEQERDAAIAARDTAIADLNDYRIQFAVISKAVSMGFRDPQDAYDLLGRKVKKIKISDDDGEPEGIDELLAELVKNKPYLTSAADEEPRTGLPETRNGNRGRGPTPAQTYLQQNYSHGKR